MSIKNRVSFDIVEEVATEAKRILLERLEEIDFGSVGSEGSYTGNYKVSFLKNNIDGYEIEIKNNIIDIHAGRKREFIAAVGKLLSVIRRLEEKGENLNDMYLEASPKYPFRIHYMPAHFGNSFEVAWPSEMQRYLEDMALAGASGYGDWFDPNDMPDPYNPRVYCSTSMSLWKRKKEFLKIAKRLGLDTMLWIAHNVGFVDQLRPEWEGTRSHKHRVQGQVLCPSNPTAREVCIQNQDNLFKDLIASGVMIDKVCFGPYDDGGCACEKCQPYYPTFLSMATELYAVVSKYYPGVRADICGWWASEEEMRQLKNYVSNEAKDWFESFQYSVTYNVFMLPSDIRTSIGDIALSTFVHIGFSHDNRDVYYKGGIHSAAARIKSIIKSFEAADCKGFHTYNETFGDHFNVYISSLLGYDPDLDIKELAYDYCRMMYGLKGSNLSDMAEILLEMEALEEGKAEKWLIVLNSIRPFVKTPLRQSWVYEHVIIKAEFMELDYKIGSGKEWKTQDDIKPIASLINRRLELSEKLWRDVYGLGILRHAFIPDIMLPSWYKSYVKLFPQEDGNIIPGSVMSKNA